MCGQTGGSACRPTTATQSADGRLKLGLVKGIPPMAPDRKHVTNAQALIQRTSLNSIHISVCLFIAYILTQKCIIIVLNGLVLAV